MNRRRLLSIGVAGLVSCVCSWRVSMAGVQQGCRAAAQTGDPQWKVLVSTKKPPACELYYYFGKVMSKDFEVNPGLGFYDDTDAPNALALPQALVQGAPDGTILMGIKLYLQDIERYYGRIFEAGRINPYFLKQALNCNIIMAHEFGHILQYKAGMNPEGPWQMELHADYLAGWWLRKHLRLLNGALVIEGIDERESLPRLRHLRWSSMQRSACSNWVILRSMTLPIMASLSSAPQCFAQVTRKLIPVLAKPL
jgi:hypothetical protein